MGRSPITALGEFIMGGEFSAADALIVFDNQQRTQGLTIESISCSGVGSCLGTTFIAGRNVFIANVECAPGACQGCRLKADENLEEMICAKPLECMAQTKTILNPANGFYFACSAEESCSMSTFRIEISNDVTDISFYYFSFV